MTHLIQHFTLELLEKGIIDRNTKPALYRDAMLARERLSQVMHDIGRELVPDADRGVIGIRNFTEEEDEALVQGAGEDTPPLPPSHRAALSFYESAALFLIFNHQANSHPLEEEASWIGHENMVEILSRIYAEKHTNNGAQVEKNIRNILKKLRTFGLVESRDADGYTYWRGTRYLPIVMTPDMAREFKRSLDELERRIAAGEFAKNDTDEHDDLFAAETEDA